MSRSISTRLRLAFLLVPAIACLEQGNLAWGQSAPSSSSVTTVSGEDDSSLFDSHLLTSSTTAETPAAVLPPQAERCIESPNLLSPDSVFSAPPAAAPAPPMTSPAPSVGSLQAGQGALTAQNNVPAFLGDYFAGSSGTVVSSGSGNVVQFPTSTGVGIMKMAEGTSPLPRDRVFVSYNYFDNVNLLPEGIPVNRLTPGFEKTFFDGNVSVEVRVPMAWTLSSDTPFDTTVPPDGEVAGYDTDHYELGNLTTFLKFLLYGDDVVALSAGLGVVAPTADDLRIVDAATGGTFNRLDNQSVHLLPFIGGTYTPNDRWFAQGLLQLDVAANGNTFYSVASANDLTPIREGVYTDPTFLFASLGTGYWVHTARHPGARLTGVALLTELHFSTSLQDTDVVGGINTTLGSRLEQIQTVNGVLGTNILIDQNKSLTLGYVMPIGGGDDQAFDGEARVLFNWYFGGALNRMSRVQF